MKFKLTGKVLARTVHNVKRQNGTSYDLYNVVVEEPGMYPSQFQVSTKDASLLGQKDGPFGVGKLVTCEGFVSSRARVINGVSGQFTKYDAYLTLSRIAPFGQNQEAAQQVSAEPQQVDDIPF